MHSASSAGGMLSGSPSAGLKAYARAIKLLQRASNAPDSAAHLEDAIAAAENMGIIEWFLRARGADLGVDKGCLTHWAGNAALISSRVTMRPSELICASVYTSGVRTFYPAAFTGTVSLFEALRWMEAEPPSVYVAPPEFSRLRKVAHKLFICLPRLMRDVRALKAGDSQMLSVALKLADALMLFEDREAEDWLLHRVALTKTTDKEDHGIVPFSFMFRGVSEMDVAILYWQTRLMILRLHAILKQRENNNNAPAPASKEELRFAKNILMSWQYADASKPFGGMSMTLALLAAWGALRYEGSVGGLSSNKLRVWIWRAISRSFLSWIFGETAADMDAAANVLSGGPLFEYTRSLFQA